MLEIKNIISEIKFLSTVSLVEWTKMRKDSRNLKIGKKKLFSLKHKENFFLKKCKNQNKS